MILYQFLLLTYYHLVLVVGGWSSRKWENFQKTCKFHRSATIDKLKAIEKTMGFSLLLFFQPLLLTSDLRLSNLRPSN